MMQNKHFINKANTPFEAHIRKPYSPIETFVFSIRNKWCKATLCIYPLLPHFSILNMCAFALPLEQGFPNCGAVDPCGPPGGSRDPLTSAHHAYCNSSFVIFYILIHLIIFLLPF